MFLSLSHLFAGEPHTSSRASDRAKLSGKRWYAFVIYSFDFEIISVAGDNNRLSYIQTHRISRPKVQPKVLKQRTQHKKI